MHHSQDYVAALAPGYFSRILQQQDTLHRYAARISRHDFSCLNDMFEATRRIALDAPVFGFDEIGEAAQALHDLVASFSAAPCRFGIERLGSLLLEFDDVVYGVSESSRPALAPRPPLHHMAPLAQMVA
ncbi:MAG: hypothetical protein ABL964_16630 [Steroidobacteraceae bacterium]